MSSTNIQFSALLLAGRPIPLSGPRDGARLSLATDDRYTITPGMDGSNHAGKTPAKSGTLAIAAFPDDEAAFILEELMRIDDASLGVAGNVPGMVKYQAGSFLWTATWTEGRILNRGTLEQTASVTAMTYSLALSRLTIDVLRVGA